MPRCNTQRLAALGLALASASPLLAQPSLVVTQNPVGASSDIVSRYSTSLGPRLAELSNVGGIRSIQSVGLGADGTGYVTYDGVTGIRVLGGVLRVPSVSSGSDARVGGGAARIYGDQTGLQAPKGLHVTSLQTRVGGIPVSSVEVMFIAENARGTVPVHTTTASGNVAPLFTVTDLGGRKPWDVFYDSAADRLFVACTDGALLVYETVSVDRGGSTVAAVIVPSLGGTKVSVNLHGVDVIAAPSGPGQILALTDVGLASSATDGAVMALPYTPGTTGNVNVTFINRGANTALGNPTDLVVVGTSAFVSEKANNQVQRYDGITTLSGDVNVAPAATRTVGGAESVVATSSGAIVTSSNVSEVGDDALYRFDPTLTTLQATFDQVPLVRDLQSVGLTSGGDAYFTFDGAANSGGGLLFRTGVGVASLNDDIGEGDALIYGPNTTLNQPKGVVVVDSRQSVLVANLGAQSIAAFSTDTNRGPSPSGNVAPAFVVTNLGTTAGGARRAIWDLHYSRTDDRLFGAGTDGVVVVFDNFFATRGIAGPTRTITPTDGTAKISVNLHGILYDRASDILVLTDVGTAASATDGQVFTIAGAATASGNTPVRFRNAGPTSQLGNPVDAALLNGTLYVAEKANNFVAQYDNVLAATGTVDVPGIRADVTAPESIWLAGSMTTAVEETPNAAAGRGLAAYPNPARDRVTLRFAVETAGATTVDLYDVLGRRVARLTETLAAGEHTRTLDTSALAAGTYVVQVRSGSIQHHQTLTVTR